MVEIMELLQNLAERIARIEVGLEEIRLVVVEKPSTKEWYTPDEAGKLLGKAPMTIREHCRFGRIRAKKRQSGRGRSLEWAISAAEVERVRNEGLLPLQRPAAELL